MEQRKTPLDGTFFARDTLLVARELLGKKLVRQLNGRLVSGIIVETEAYCGRFDSACHAHRGQTKRNIVMFGPPGRAYVYFTYGMHHLLNLVTEPEGSPCAVLLRAIEAQEGIRIMENRRKKTGRLLTDGPAKLCQAMDIDLKLNGWDVTVGRKLWVEDAPPAPPDQIVETPRIGIGYAQPQDRDALRRFLYRP